MQNGYVLSIPKNLASLEQDMIAWLNLPYDLRKQGNDACIRKYGCTNEQLYNIMKAKLVNIDMSEYDHDLSMETYLFKNKRVLKGITEATFKVDPEDAVSGFTNDGQINDRLSKIKRSNDITDSVDDDVVMINDFVDDNNPDYTLEDLEQRYQMYLSANSDHRKKADNYSMEIWGRNVINMYAYMKGKFETIAAAKDENSYTPTLEQQRLDSFRHTVMNESSNDIVNSIVRSLDCYKKSDTRSVYESVILEQFGDTINLNGHSFRQDMPGVMPFLTYYEYLHNTRHLDQRKIHAKNPFCYVLNRINNKKNIEDLYNNHDNGAMLDNGWNPYIKPTAEAFKRAYERQVQFFDENYNFDIYNIADFHTGDSDDVLTEETRSNVALSPIFVTFLTNSTSPAKLVDRTYKYEDFNRLGISLSSDLKKVYSYEMMEDYVNRVNSKNGIEEIDRVNTVYRLKTDNLSKSGSGNLHLLTLFVTPDIKKDIREGLATYMDNQDNSKYSFDSILSVMNNKRVNRSLSIYIMIAMFLDSIFRVSNVYDKNSDKGVSYNFLGKAKNKQDGSKRKIYIMYNGDLSGYKSNKIDKKVKWLLDNVDRIKMNFFDNNIIVPTQPDYYDFNTYINDFKNTSTNESAKFLSLIEEMRKILTPTSFIQESTFDYSVEDIDLRFKIAIQLLDSYNETELEGIKKQCKELFILYNICSIVIKNAKNDPDAKLLETILVSIDYKLNFYIRFIKNLEPDFDIYEYSKLPYDPDHDIIWKNSVYCYGSNNFKYKPNVEDI